MPDPFDVHNPQHRRIALGATATTLIYVGIVAQIVLWTTGVLPNRSPFLMGLCWIVAAFAFGRMFGRWERS